MNYLISGGVQKNILQNDAIEIADGVLDGVKAMIVLDATDPGKLLCAVVNFDTFQVFDSLYISPSWITNVWRIA